MPHPLVVLRKVEGDPRWDEVSQIAEVMLMGACLHSQRCRPVRLPWPRGRWPPSTWWGWVGWESSPSQGCVGVGGVATGGGTVSAHQDLQGWHDQGERLACNREGSKCTQKSDLVQTIMLLKHSELSPKYLQEMTHSSTARTIHGHGGEAGRGCRWERLCRCHNVATAGFPRCYRW